jgi:hypothetical protein
MLPAEEREKKKLKLGKAIRKTLELEQNLIFYSYLGFCIVSIRKLRLVDAIDVKTKWMDL